MRARFLCFLVPLLLLACSPAPIPQPPAAKNSPSATLSDLRVSLDQALADSRAVLLGTRDPNGESCQIYKGPRITDSGYKPPPKGDPNGGPGNRLLHIYYWEHSKAVASPTEDLTWHQTVFRKELESLLTRNRDAAAKVDAALRILGSLSPNAMPIPGSTPASAPASPNWPLYCLDRFSAALQQRDPDASRWADELRTSLLALQDLHRWVTLVIENQLFALDFQVLGESLFADMVSEYEGKYDALQCISRFPGGSLCVSALNNYFEIERQAETHFRAPAAFASAAESAGRLLKRVSAATHLTPDVRQSFGTLRERLNPSLQSTWDAAAALPYERTFLINHLFRAQESKTIDSLAVVLERFSKRHPTATVNELMDAVVYRAGLGMSGLEWEDRYDPRLMEAAATLTADTSEDLYRAAHRWAFTNVYKNSRSYRTMVLSLRAALDTRKYDCIRGTDMLAALYRNAGGHGLFNVRWTRGDNAHTIAGLRTTGADGEPQLLVLDSLLAPGQEERWPDDYLRPRGEIYAVEINGRGLDNYLMLEGRILRGPNAGRRVATTLPYLPPARSPAATKPR